MHARAGEGVRGALEMLNGCSLLTLSGLLLWSPLGSSPPLLASAGGRCDSRLPARVGPAPPDATPHRISACGRGLQPRLLLLCYPWLQVGEGMAGCVVGWG